MRRILQSEYNHLYSIVKILLYGILSTHSAIRIAFLFGLLQNNGMSLRELCRNFHTVVFVNVCINDRFFPYHYNCQHSSCIICN